MSGPYRYVDLATLMGSWPMAPRPGYTTPTVLPNSVYHKATILGVRKAAVYAMGQAGSGVPISSGTGDFTLKLDDPNNPGTPYSHVIVFPQIMASATLDEVVTAINSTATITAQNRVVAYNDNGFLRLESDTVGADSYLEVQSNVNEERTVSELGLFSGTVARGGDIKQTQHFDPTRQVSGQGQLAMGWGEQPSAEAFNRMSFQLAYNADRTKTLLDDKLVATRTTETVTYFSTNGGATLNLGSSQGVYCGANGTPTLDQLRDVVTVLDMNGNEYTKEIRYDNGFYPSEAMSIWTDSDSKETHIQSASGNFSTSQVGQAYFIHILTNTALASSGLVESALVYGPLGSTNPSDWVHLKIIRYISATEVVVDAVTTSGVTVDVGASVVSCTAQLLLVRTKRCEVEKIWRTPSKASRAEQTEYSITSGAQTVTRIGKNNQITVNAASFTTDGTTVGDRVKWTEAVPGDASSDPYTNIGDYRVAKVIDDETLELLSDSFDPIYLNTNPGTNFGQVEVYTDKDFKRTPFVEFYSTAGLSTLPENGEQIQLSYMVAKTIREAASDITFFAGPSVRFGQEATTETQAALMRILGPDVTSFSEVLYGEDFTSLQEINYRFNKEHSHPHGMHSVITAWAPSASELELLTLQGYDASSTRVSMGYKPMFNQPSMFHTDVRESGAGALAQVDTGDWTVDFRTTATMDTQSTSEAWFRWLTGSTIAGTGQELLTLSKANGLQLVDEDQTATSSGVHKGKLSWLGESTARASANASGLSAWMQLKKVTTTNNYILQMFTNLGTTSSVSVKNPNSFDAGLHIGQEPAYAAANWHTPLVVNRKNTGGAETATVAEFQSWDSWGGNEASEIKMRDGGSSNWLGIGTGADYMWLREGAAGNKILWIGGLGISVGSDMDFAEVNKGKVHVTGQNSPDQSIVLAHGEAVATDAGARSTILFSSDGDVDYTDNGSGGTSYNRLTPTYYDTTSDPLRWKQAGIALTHNAVQSGGGTWNYDTAGMAHAYKIGIDTEWSSGQGANSGRISWEVGAGTATPGAAITWTSMLEARPVDPVTLGPTVTVPTGDFTVSDGTVTSTPGWFQDSNGPRSNYKLGTAATWQMIKLGSAGVGRSFNFPKDDSLVTVDGQPNVVIYNLGVYKFYRIDHEARKASGLNESYEIEYHFHPPYQSSIAYVLFYGSHIIDTSGGNTIGTQVDVSKITTSNIIAKQINLNNADYSLPTGEFHYDSLGTGPHTIPLTATSADLIMDQDDVLVVKLRDYAPGNNLESLTVRSILVGYTTTDLTPTRGSG